MEIKRYPVRFYFALFLAGAGLLAAAGWYWLPLPALSAWLIAANLVAYAIWAWDKRAARKGMHRVPEWTLHLMALGGATPASLIAMQALRHKTQERKFTLGHSILLGLQIFAALIYFRPPGGG